jgi:hydrogenase maturation protein HypF
MALSTLWAYSLPWDERLAPVAYLSTQEREILRHQLENQVNTPTTSSMGRLFDAVSALIGVQEEITYDAQAAIELEALVRPGELGYYPWQFQEPLIDLKPMLEAILDDIFTGLPKTIISSKFHNTIANICLELAMLIHQRFSIEYFALSGGVWQNLNLLNPVVKQLKMQNLNPLTHKLMPTNDGCISFGQAMICASKFKND